MKKTGLLKSYSGATRLLAPALPFWLNKRAKNGKEDPKRLSERQGITSKTRPKGPMVWMHAASVGESQMLMPLISKIIRARPKTNIVITTGTVTSAELLHNRLPHGAVHQYAPADHPKAVRNFLSHWKPDFAIFAESELWPNMIFETKKRNIPLALINARMSDESIESWGKKARKSAKAILQCFDVILAANTETANGLSWLIGRDIESAGNLKDAAPALDVNADDLKAFKSAIGRRTVWCATSTHKGEEEIVLSALGAVKEKRKNSLLLLAPRHPERVDEVEKIFNDAGYKTQRRTKGQFLGASAPPGRDIDVYIFDTIGELGLVYRLCRVALIGGSLVKGLSGHNPLEAARLDCAIITGAQISSFADTYMALMAFGGVKRVLAADQLGDTVLELLSDKEVRDGLLKRATDYAKSRDAVLDFVWEHLLAFIPEQKKSVK